METDLSHYLKTARFVLQENMKNRGVGMTSGELAKALKLSRYYAGKMLERLEDFGIVVVYKTYKKNNRLGKNVYMVKSAYKLTTIDEEIARQHLGVIHHG